MEEQILWQNEDLRIIAVDDDMYPGYCRIIWNEHIQELTDLHREHQIILWESMLCLERTIRTILTPDKINWASFGNQVPHLHWHCIPRFKDDPHFPESIWGKIQREKCKIVRMESWQNLCSEKLKNNMPY
jgi:diadenosine tetraphosphate (Ap4A) HIT family hydrolase